VQWRASTDAKRAGADYLQLRLGCPCQFNSLPTNGNCRAAETEPGATFFNVFAGTFRAQVTLLHGFWKAGHAHLSMLYLTPKGPVH
jgi:hypothetical protein